MSYKGNTLELFPIEKEICVRLNTTDDIDISKSHFYFDKDKLYKTDKYIKKGWKMFISRPLDRIYILNGTAKIKTSNITGNIGIKAKYKDVSASGTYYLNVPFLCTSILDSDYDLPELHCTFLYEKSYCTKIGSEIYIVGRLIMDK